MRLPEASVPVNNPLCGVSTRLSPSGAHDSERALDSSIGKSGWGDTMGENKPLVVYAAAYETVEAALADLDDIEQLSSVLPV